MIGSSNSLFMRQHLPAGEPADIVRAGIRNYKANLELQPTLCQNAVKVRANYGACAIIHQNDSNFYTKNWRVFLGRQREMWAKGEDTITLIDRQGNTIAEKSY
jgi:hypothetical protein